MTERIFCGIEGGGSFSKLVLVSEKGKILCWIDGPSSNHYQIGLQECHKILCDMIDQAKLKASIPADTYLSGLGLSMSGCEGEESNLAFERTFLKTYPDVSKHCKVTSDTVGALFTASPEGGLVMIAGTGSNALLVNPNGTTARCGGWGHLIGDEGSAMWISLKAVKTVFDAEDNLAAPPHDVTKVKDLILQHFEVQDKFGILKHCYVDFKKSFFAALCAKLAEAACNEKDLLCCHLFYEAGKVLAQTVNTIAPKVQKELGEKQGGLPIVCVGSVFKSWNLLKSGFQEHISCNLKEFTMVRLNSSAAVGAAYLGAKESGFELPVNANDNVSVLHHYKKYF